MSFFAFEFCKYRFTLNKRDKYNCNFFFLYYVEKYRYKRIILITFKILTKYLM